MSHQGSPKLPPSHRDLEHPFDMKRKRASKRVRQRIRTQREQRQQERDRDVVEDLDYDAFLELDSTQCDDSLDFLEAITGENFIGEKCALHTFERRIDSHGEEIILQVGAREEVDFEERRSQDVALVLTREYSDSKVLLSTKLEIQSPYIKTAMQKVITSYPGVYLDLIGPIVLHDEPKCLFHYRKELQAQAANLDNSKAKQHINLCLRYMARALRKEIQIYDNTMHQPDQAPGLEYSVLWMAFRPGDLIYHKHQDGKENVFRLVFMERREMYREQTLTEDYWALKGEKIICAGHSLKYAYEYGSIHRYHGYQSLSRLELYPLKYHEAKDQTMQRLLDRGKKYLSLIGTCYRQYDGAAKVFPAGMEDEGDWQTRLICQRIMFGSGEFRDNVAPFQEQMIAFCKPLDMTSDEHLSISDEETLMCDYELPGFCLSSKQWGLFDVAKIKSIDFNSTAFDSLVLDSVKKKIISSLVKEEIDRVCGFDDIVKGKGKGLIFLLHGEPGTGKTLTAESIADYTQRPLYTIGCGDLGVNGSHVESMLNASLALATKWNALVLMDEADVFMEARSNNELQRNELVSVLLRTLEYFEGIMFLTTNRIGTIDSAFKSRIHLSLSYPVLDTAARRSIWQNFIGKYSNKSTTNRLGSDFLEEISKETINGRQIKNIVRVAYAQATHAKRDLEPEDITMGLVAHKNFEIEFSTTQKQRERNGDLKSFLATACILLGQMSTRPLPTALLLTLALVLLVYSVVTRI